MHPGLKRVPLLLSLLLMAAAPAPSTPVVYDFDWDDNIAFMPTRILLYKKGDDKNLETKAVSTADFALVREELGKPGPWQQYEVRVTPEQHSFASFLDAGDGPGGKNFFLSDLQTIAAKGKPEKWKAPAWPALVHALSDAKTAAQVSVITARGHSADEMLEGFQWLKGQGYFKHLPPRERLHAVGSAKSPSAAKAEIMVEQLAKLEKVSPGPRGHHVWTFSDDDWGNFEKAREAIAGELKKGRFQNTKVLLFFTGLNHPTHPPHGIALKLNGETRPIGSAEEPDVTRFFTLGPGQPAKAR